MNKAISIRLRCWDEKVFLCLTLRTAMKDNHKNRGPLEVL